MIYIFFIYGLAFFSFGLALLLYPKEVKGIEFTKHIWLVGVFGIVHGFNEWIDMFQYISETKNELFKYVQFIILPLSYIFLLYFALLSLTKHYKYFLYNYINFIVIFLTISFFMLSFNDENIFLAANVWARYLFGIPGVLLSAYIFFLEKDTGRIYTIRNARIYMIFLSFTFFAYGILSGLIVPKAPIYLANIINQELFKEYIGLPVQLFRALFALFGAYLVIALLKSLKHEIQIQLIKLSKAIEVSGDIVVITDKKGFIEYVNPAFEEETGYSQKEVLGTKSSILKSDMHEMTFYEGLWTTILNGEVFKDYFINKKRNGELYNEYKAIAPIIDFEGKITNFVSTGKDVTQRILLEKNLEKLASTDKLTGISNRMRFDELMHYSVDRAKLYKISLSLILFDIDNFKKVNDTYGHLSGDSVLKAIADIGEENIRKSDLFARWGGEEFVILQPDIPEDEACVLAERLRKAVESHNFNGVGKITASFGVTTFKEGDDINSFLLRVDKALYLAKTKGKNRVAKI